MGICATFRGYIDVVTENNTNPIESIIGFPIIYEFV